jgi:hypothetical protein
LALGTFNNLASLVTFSTIARKGDQAGVRGATSPVECQKWQLELFFKGIQPRKRWQPQISVSAFRTFNNLASFVEQFLDEKKKSCFTGIRSPEVRKHHDHRTTTPQVSMLPSEVLSFCQSPHEFSTCFHCLNLTRELTA